MLVDVTKLMIPRTCTSVHTKNKNTVETGHCTETWDDLAHFSVFNHLFVHFHSTVTVPAGQYRVKNSPAQHVGGVNEETVNLLQGARWQTCEIITSIYLNLSQDSSFQVPSSSSQLGSALTTVFSLSLTHTHTLSNDPRSFEIPILSILCLCHVAQSSCSSSGHHSFIPPPRKDKWERREALLFPKAFARGLTTPTLAFHWPKCSQCGHTWLQGGVRKGSHLAAQQSSQSDSRFFPQRAKLILGISATNAK